MSPRTTTRKIPTPVEKGHDRVGPNTDTPHAGIDLEVHRDARQPVCHARQALDHLSVQTTGSKPYATIYSLSAGSVAESTRNLACTPASTKAMASATWATHS